MLERSVRWLVRLPHGRCACRQRLAPEASLLAVAVAAPDPRLVARRRHVGGRGVGLGRCARAMSLARGVRWVEGRAAQDANSRHSEHATDDQAGGAGETLHAFDRGRGREVGPGTLVPVLLSAVHRDFRPWSRQSLRRTLA